MQARIRGSHVYIFLKTFRAAGIVYRWRQASAAGRIGKDCYANRTNIAIGYIAQWTLEAVERQLETFSFLITFLHKHV